MEDEEKPRLLLERGQLGGMSRVRNDLRHHRQRQQEQLLRLLVKSVEVEWPSSVLGAKVGRTSLPFFVVVDVVGAGVGFAAGVVVVGFVAESGAGAVAAGCAVAVAGCAVAVAVAAGDVGGAGVAAGAAGSGAASAVHGGKQPALGRRARREHAG